MIQAMRSVVVLALAGCTASSPAISDLGVDLSSAVAPSPFVQRLTQSSTSEPQINLTQWNWNRQIAVDDSGGVHVAWARLGTTDVNLPADRPDPIDTTQLPSGQIFYKRSTDGGRTWSSDLALTTAAVGIDSASVATSGSRVYVLWRALDGGRLRAFLRASSDGGSSFGAAVAVSDNPSGISLSAPALATDSASSGAAVYAVWADGRAGAIKEIYFSSSHDQGATWSASKAVSTPDGFSSWTPALAVWSGAVHVAWTDERDDVGECTKGMNSCHEEEYYRRSSNDGATWGPEVRLTTDPPGMPKESWAPSLAVWGSSVHIAYLDHRTGFFQIYYRHSSDGGASFAPEQMIASDSKFQNAARPTIAAREGDVHLTWFGFTQFDADIYYARSRDDGATFAPFVDLTPLAAKAARIPHVAVAPDHTAHVIWYDTRLSNAVDGVRIELFYGRPNG
jgi:hypothetical protein